VEAAHVSVSFSTTYVALWVLVVLQGLLILALIRELAQLRLSFDRQDLTGANHLSRGSRAPDFSGVDAHSGELVHLRNMLYGRGGIVLFLSPLCSICGMLAESLQKHGGEALPPLLAVCSGGERACSGLTKRIGRQFKFLAQEVDEAVVPYGISGFPTAVFIDPELRVVSYGTPNDADDLKRLYDRAVGKGKSTAAADAA
jgi:hypothetical protein